MGKTKTKVSGTVIAAILISVSLLGAVWYINEQGGFNIVFESVLSDSNGFDSDAPLAPTDPTQPSSPPPTTPPATGIEPTSLMVSLTPNPVVMGNTLYGTVVSNGKDYPITIHALHVGTATEQTYGGLLGASGKFYDNNPMTIPGYWDFWATTDTVTSNKPRVTVQGVLIVLPSDHYSQTLGSPMTAQLYSHTSGNALIIAVDPEAGTSTPLTNSVIHTNGYGEISLDFSVLSRGNYMIDVVINGLKASTYDGDAPLTVGR